jgi:hypothetical protein
MAKTPKNRGKPWTPAEVQQLKRQLNENTPPRVMGLKHERTPDALRSKTNKLGLSTKPVNHRPYSNKTK